MKAEKILPFILYLALYSSIAMFSGAFFSGYHYVDDHEIIRILHDLENIGLWETLSKWLGTDFNIRLRPLYYVHRILQCLFFGLNFKLWHSYLLLFITCSSYGIYRIFKNLKWNSFPAFMIPLFVFLGKTSPVLWRLGPGEVFSLGLMTIAFYLVTTEGRGKYFALVWLLCAGLVKESFLLVFPALVLFRLLTLYKIKDFLFCCRKEWLFILIGAFLNLAPLFLIKYYIGSEKIDYAGVSGFNLNSFFTTFKAFFKLTYFKHIFLFLIPLFVYFFKEKSKSQLRDFLKTFFTIILWSIVLVLPQIFLYTKSGIYERYLIPGIISVGMIFCLPLEYVTRLHNETELTLRTLNPRKLVLTLLLLGGGVLIYSSGELRNTVLSFYSDLVGKKIKPHYKLKLELISLGIFLFSSFYLASMKPEINSKIHEWKNRLKISSKLSFLLCALLIFSILDRSFTGYRYGVTFSEKGEVINEIFKAYGEAENDLTIISDLAASEFLFSFISYSKIILKKETIKLLPFENKEKGENFKQDKKLREDSKKRYEEKLISGFDEALKSELIVLGPLAFKAFDGFIKRNGYQRMTDNHYYLYKRVN